MAEKETPESQQEFSDVVSVCDDFEVIEPDIGSDPVRRSFHDDLESEKTPTASPTQSVFLNTMSIEGSEKSFCDLEDPSHSKSGHQAADRRIRGQNGGNADEARSRSPSKRHPPRKTRKSEGRAPSQHHRENAVDGTK
ncbi:unnamed protein product, partial [Mesorhabditis belari]|uniref:Uncharacterized protein n=1 Tax=Mesorhabditis belari TaxID=2138241 RepID=A0AAF3FQ16_9BILA